MKSEPRQIQNLDRGWKFKYAAGKKASATSCDDKSWETVNLPHTWNAVDGADGGADYKRGAGWYRLKFKAPALPSGKRAYLCFEGVNTVARVFLNGKEVGTHYGGYSGFRFDITSSMVPGAWNLLSVSADNSYRDDVPPIKGDFTFFGGIYRSVSLLIVSSLSLDLMDYGGSGIYLATPDIAKGKGTVLVLVRVFNSEQLPKDAELRFSVLGESGKVLESIGTVLTALPGLTELNLSLTVKNPKLWNGRIDPYLYRARVDLFAGGKLCDRSDQSLGFRWFSMDPKKGFVLNGKPYDLHGVCLHQETEGKGYAATDSDRDEDYALVRESGATYVRLAHYQHPQHAYDLCDRAGLVVWAEHAMVNKVSENPLFAERAVTQLTELIRQNFNHPSIVVWGIGNEVQTGNPAAPALLERLATLVKVEDPSRKCVIATDKDEAGGAYGTEVIAHNKYFGWYYKDFPDFPKWLDAQRAKAPKIPMGISEYGAGAGPSIHSSNPKNQDHSEEYQCLYHEAYWNAMKVRPWLWSKSVWNMFDFASDGRDEGEKPGINDKGLVSRDRKTRKDSFYWYKANWTTEPMAHITSRRFTPRIEKKTDIKVYSNCDKVKLVLNGKSIGEKKVVGSIALWKGVSLQAGKNRVEVSSGQGKARVGDSCEWVLKEKP